jgi:hypothetical protein
MATLEEIVQQLPPELRREVQEYAEALLRRHDQKKDHRLRQDWAGALSDYKDQYTGVQLQKKTLEWWGD